jgi:hypothetical protein
VQRAADFSIASESDPVGERVVRWVVCAVVAAVGLISIGVAIDSTANSAVDGLTVTMAVIGVIFLIAAVMTARRPHPRGTMTVANFGIRLSGAQLMAAFVQIDPIELRGVAIGDNRLDVGQLKLAFSDIEFDDAVKSSQAAAGGAGGWHVDLRATKCWGVDPGKANVAIVLRWPRMLSELFPETLPIPRDAFAEVPIVALFVDASNPGAVADAVGGALPSATVARLSG